MKFLGSVAPTTSSPPFCHQVLSRSRSMFLTQRPGESIRKITNNFLRSLKLVVRGFSIYKNYYYTMPEEYPGPSIWSGKFEGPSNSKLQVWHLYWLPVPQRAKDCFPQRVHLISRPRICPASFSANSLRLSGSTPLSRLSISDFVCRTAFTIKRTTAPSTTTRMRLNQSNIPIFSTFWYKRNQISYLKL